MTASPAPLLEIENLSIDYGGLRAVDDVSIHLLNDEILSLIGPNGAGKTSLFNSITGYVRPTRGRVTFQGDDITNMKPFKVSRLGLNRTFQKASYMPDLTVWSNLSIAAMEAEIHRQHNRVRTIRDPAVQERAEAVLALVGLQRQAHHLARNLPYGGQRRLGIAIALCMEPAALLLDEPCAGMNAAEIQQLIDLFAKLRERRLSMIVVEHQMRFVMGISDRVVVLHHGRKLAEGTPDEVAHDDQVIEAYLGHQGGAA